MTATGDALRAWPIWAAGHFVLARTTADIRELRP